MLQHEANQSVAERRLEPLSVEQIHGRNHSSIKTYKTLEKQRIRKIIPKFKNPIPVPRLTLRTKFPQIEEKRANYLSNQPGKRLGPHTTKNSALPTLNNTNRSSIERKPFNTAILVREETSQVSLKPYKKKRQGRNKSTLQTEPVSQSTSPMGTRQASSLSVKYPEPKSPDFGKQKLFPIIETSTSRANLMLN